MRLEKIFPRDIDPKVHATISDMARLFEKDVLSIGKAIKEAKLTPIASIKTGRPGRPPFVFDRNQLVEVVKKAIEVELAQSIALTNQTDIEISIATEEVA